MCFLFCLEALNVRYQQGVACGNTLAFIQSHFCHLSNHTCGPKMMTNMCVFVVQGWFSPGQVFVLDEYCARNGVRGCHRHLCYLRDLLERAENGAIIDPTLLHYSFAFCASHVHGNRCDLIC